MKRYIIIVLVVALTFLLACSRPYPTDTIEVTMTDNNTLESTGYIEHNDTYIWTSNTGKEWRKVYQDVDTISEAQDIITGIPLPNYYSTYNGIPLSTNTTIQVSIGIYDYRTGVAKLSAQATLADVSPINIVLVYEKPSGYEGETYVMYSPNDQFTLGELREHPEWFTWRHADNWRWE